VADPTDAAPSPLQQQWAILESLRIFPMKTERRHELEHNELADRVGASMEQVAPYGKQIAAGLLAVFIIVLGYRWYAGSIRARDEKAWEGYIQAMSMRSSDAAGGQSLRRSKLQEVISNKNLLGSPAAVWARLSLADDELERGIDHLFNNRSEGEKDLEKAQENYQLVLKEAAKLSAKHSSAILPRAKLGVARAMESLGNVKDALVVYKEVEKQFPVSAFKSVAQKRVAALENVKAENFYDWLQEQDTRPTVPAGKGEPGVRPEFDPFSDDPFGKSGPPAGLDLDSLKSPKGILPDVDPPKSEPKGETPKAETPKGETKAETPKAETKPEESKKDAKDEAKKDAK
jgi:hypothetical protein